MSAAASWTKPWVVPASFLLAALGATISAYLTFEHFTGSTTLACSSSGVVDCHKVTTSKYATLAGVPVAVLGLGYFMVMVALCLPQAWAQGKRLRAVRLTMAIVGIAAVMYLVWAEMALGSICLWCTGVHVIALALLLVLIMGEASFPPYRSTRTVHL